MLVRDTLSEINNTTPVFTEPKTRTGYAWIGLSDRIVAVLRRHADQHALKHAADERFHDHDLAFTAVTDTHSAAITSCDTSTTSPTTPAWLTFVCTTSATAMLSAHVTLATASKKRCGIPLCR